ncbi:MAG: diacylglycerol kinase family protein [bacterium]
MRTHTISFRHAIRGITHSASTQLNLRIHLMITTLVIFLSIWLEVTVVEVLVLLLTIALVLTAELLNTAIEYLGDAITLENNEFLKNAKDTAAGAVLVSAIFAALIGLTIFVPKLL